MLLDPLERFLRYLDGFLIVVPAKADVLVIEPMIPFGRFLLSVTLKDPSILSHFSSSLPSLDSINIMPEVAESALIFARMLYSLYHERFRILHEREDLDIAMGLVRTCITTKANRDVPVDEWHMSEMLLQEYRITVQYDTIIEALDHACAALEGGWIDDPDHLVQLSILLMRHHNHTPAKDLDRSIGLMESAITFAEKKGWSTLKMRRELNFAQGLKTNQTSASMDTEVSDMNIVHPCEEDCSSVQSASNLEYVKRLNPTFRFHSYSDCYMPTDNTRLHRKPSRMNLHLHKRPLMKPRSYQLFSDKWGMMSYWHLHGPQNMNQTNLIPQLK